MDCLVGGSSPPQPNMFFKANFTRAATLPYTGFRVPLPAPNKRRTPKWCPIYFYMLDIEEYHKTRSCLDYKFIENQFLKDDREFLLSCTKTTRLPQADLVAAGLMKGYGGAVFDRSN